LHALAIRLSESPRSSRNLRSSAPSRLKVRAFSETRVIHHRSFRSAKAGYELGERSGAWQKMPINQGQEFVIAGYTSSASNFDAIIFGYYDGGELMYAGRTRNGFTPPSRVKLFKRF
jgi:hypothetical protein